MGFFEIHRSYTFKDGLGMSVSERKHIYIGMRMHTCITGTFKKLPACIYYANFKKIAHTYAMQF